MAPEETPSPAGNGVLSVRVADDFALDGGRWELAETKDRQPVAWIAPPVTPMFQQLVAYLERKPTPRGGNCRRDEEARAAVAVCLRWGSYFAVLADAARPAASDLDDGRVSHIADDELGTKRIPPRAEQAIIRRAQGGVNAGLKAVDMLRYSEAWPPSADQVLPFLHPLVGPARWSYTEDSRAVELRLRGVTEQDV